MMDNETVRNFRRDGYVALPGFLDQNQCAELRDNVKRYRQDVVPKMLREHVFYEDKSDKSSLKQLQKMADYDDYFHAMLIGSRFETLAKTLLETDVNGVNLQYFNKPPGIGRATPPHQDGYYFMLEPNEAVTMWLALEQVDQENGCVRYARGSHLDGLRPHGQTETLGFSQGLLDFGQHDIDREIAFPAKPGDLLVHHALTVHRADGNRSQSRSRQALGLIYFARNAKESEQKAKRQSELVDRLVDSGKL